MSTQVQYRRGTEAQNNAFTGALGEITVDTTNNSLRVHDGVTAGGTATVSANSAALLQTGNLLPQANVTYNLGSNTKMWNALYVSGNTIYLGNLQLKEASANTFAVFTSDGTTQANIDVGNIDVSSIVQGTSTIGISGVNGDAFVTVGGTSNVLVVATTGTVTTGVASATGNIVGANINTAGLISAAGNITGNYILGNGSQLTGIDATSIQSGTSNVRVVSSGGNVSAGVGGTANVLVIASTGTFVTGLSSVTGNITAGNIDTAGLISASGNITGNYIFGNGSQLTGIDATSIQFGTSNVRVVSSGGNVAAGIGGTANVLVIASTGTYVTGLTSVTGNVTAGNIDTGGAISATGNVNGGNVIASALVQSTTLSASGNVIGGNVTTGGLVSATGNLIGGNVNAGNIQPTSGALTLSTVSNANVVIQPNGTGNIVLSNTYINSVRYPVQAQDAASREYVDNLVSTAISYHQPVAAATTTTLATTTGGTITYDNGTSGQGATLTTTGAFNLIDTANVQTANTRILVKDEANAAHNGIYIWSSATVITRSSDADTYGAGNVNALGLNDYFFVSGGNVNKGAAYVVSAPTGTITFGTSNITFAEFSTSQTYTANTQAGITLVGTVITAKTDNNTTAFDGGGNIIVKASANLTTPNIGAATGTSVSVTGNVIAGNVTTDGLVSATGNVNGGNVIAATLVQGTTLSATGNINGGNVNGGANVNATTHTGTTVSVTGNITGGNVLGGANVNATTHTGTTVSVTGLITGGNLTVSTGNVTLGNIVNAGANGVGNIGSSTLYFNTVFAKATSAQYADLAEMYQADGPIQPGTVVAFGGTREVTTCTQDGDRRVAGVVSTNPSYIMNAQLSGEHVVAVALIGRVPTLVTGPIAKGDMLVAAGGGRARAESNPGPGQIIGKALADFDGTEGTIEVAVGRL